jgi:hypothetical protein
MLNSNTNKANWITYDTNLDEWTKSFLGEKPKRASSLNSNKLYSKYGSEFTFMKNAPLKNIAKPTIEFLRDEYKGNQHLYRIKIISNRKVNRYDIFVNGAVQINNLRANGVTAINFKSNISGKSNRKLLTYYVLDNLPLDLEFSINEKDKLDLDLMESSFDLMTNSQFKLTLRKSWMIPTPFVLNDAIIIKEKIIASPNTVSQKLILKNYNSVTKDNLTTIDSIH